MVGRRSASLCRARVGARLHQPCRTSPTFSPTIGTCRYDAVEGTNAAYPRAGRRLCGGAGSSSAKSPCSSVETSGLRRFSNYVAAVTPAQIGTVAHHLYTRRDGPITRRPDTFITPIDDGGQRANAAQNRSSDDRIFAASAGDVSRRRAHPQCADDRRRLGLAIWELLLGGATSGVPGRW